MDLQLTDLSSQPGLSSPIRIGRIAWPPGHLTLEIIRLLIRDDQNSCCNGLGLAPDALAAWRFACLSTGNGWLWAADDGTRLVGLLHLTPRAWPGFMADRKVFSVRQLVIARSAPAATAKTLLDYALYTLEQQGELGLVEACLPALSIRAIDGLRGAGFKEPNHRSEMSKFSFAHLERRPDSGEMSEQQSRKLLHTIGLAAQTESWVRLAYRPSNRGSCHCIPRSRWIMALNAPHSEGLFGLRDSDNRLIGVACFHNDPTTEIFSGISGSMVDVFAY